MNKVITINLRGRAYQLEEGGYNALQDYLREAAGRLQDDPDRQEILADLEQSIAEKFDRRLAPGKNVVTEQEVAETLKDMGPVQAPAGETAGSAPKKETAAPHKRLYKIREGAVIAGVCTGLAAYFNVDLTLVRVIFVALAILTHGAWIVVYILMMLIIPSATTSAETAAAFGQPYTAQDLIDRARTEYQKFADKAEWKKWKYEAKQKLRREKWEARQAYRAFRPSPALGFFMAILSLLWLLGLLGLISRGAVFGYAVPADLPRWIAILVWLCLYGFIMSPLKALRWTHYCQPGAADGVPAYYHQSHGDFAESIAWMAFFVLLGWAAWRYVPVTHVYAQQAWLWLQHVTASWHLSRQA